MRFEFDVGLEVFDCGRVLVGGSPSRLFRLSDTGAKVLDRWRSGRVVALDSVELALLDRLVDAGCVHPVGVRRSDRSSISAAMPTVIVPVKDRPTSLDRCLVALAASGVERVIVVDDGSLDPDAHRSVVERHRGVTLVRRSVSGGPAVARMDGLAHLADIADTADGSGPIVGFVDSDVVVDREWLSPLLVLFDDPKVALVAPRVTSGSRSGALLDRYEAAASPLDLGAARGRVRAGSRISYVPAAALLARRKALESVGGFDTSMRVGEDVDLAWRLDSAGWHCRYEPDSIVHHARRRGATALARQRFGYGESAAALDEIHPGAVPPLRCSSSSLAVIGLIARRYPMLAAGVTASNSVALARKLSFLPDAGRVSARFVVRGHVGAARAVARGMLRPWFPVAALLAIAGRSGRRIVAAATLVTAINEWRRHRPAIGPLRWSALWVADEVAYSAGVGWGCLRRRRWRPLVPELTSWPGRAGASDAG